MCNYDDPDLQPGALDDNGFTYVEPAPTRPVKVAGPQFNKHGQSLPWNEETGVDRLAKWADGVWPGKGVGFKIGTFGRTKPDGIAQYWLIDIERAALEVAIKAVQGETIKKTAWDLIHAILRNWTLDHKGDPGPWNAQEHINDLRSQLDDLTQPIGRSAGRSDPADDLDKGLFVRSQPLKGQR